MLPLWSSSQPGMLSAWETTGLNHVSITKPRSCGRLEVMRDLDTVVRVELVVEVGCDRRRHVEAQPVPGAPLGDPALHEEPARGDRAGGYDDGVRADTQLAPVRQAGHHGRGAAPVRLDPLRAALGQHSERVHAEQPLPVGQHLVEHRQLRPERAADVAVAAAGTVGDVRFHHVDLALKAERAHAVDELLRPGLQVAARRPPHADEAARVEERLREPRLVEPRVELRAVPAGRARPAGCRSRRRCSRRSSRRRTCPGGPGS